MLGRTFQGGSFKTKEVPLCNLQSATGLFKTVRVIIRCWDRVGVLSVWSKIG